MSWVEREREREKQKKKRWQKNMRKGGFGSCEQESIRPSFATSQSSRETGILAQTSQLNKSRWWESGWLMANETEQTVTKSDKNRDFDLTVDLHDFTTFDLNLEDWPSAKRWDLPWGLSDSWHTSSSVRFWKASNLEKHVKANYPAWCVPFDNFRWQQMTRKSLSFAV